METVLVMYFYYFLIIYFYVLFVYLHTNFLSLHGILTSYYYIVQLTIHNKRTLPFKMNKTCPIQHVKYKTGNMDVKCVSWSQTTFAFSIGNHYNLSFHFLLILMRSVIDNFTAYLPSTDRRSVKNL